MRLAGAAWPLANTISACIHGPTLRRFVALSTSLDSTMVSSIEYYQPHCSRSLSRSSNSSTTQQIVRESVTLRVPASFANSEQNSFLSLWLVYVPIGSGAVVSQRRRTISPTKSASTSTCETTRSHCAAPPALTARTCTALPWWTSSLPTPRHSTRHRCSVICSLRQGRA